MLCHTNKSKINYRKIQKCMTGEYLGETKFLYKEYSLKFNLTFRLTRKVISPPWYRREWRRGGGGGRRGLMELLPRVFDILQYFKNILPSETGSAWPVVPQQLLSNVSHTIKYRILIIKNGVIFFFVFKNLFSFSRLNRFLFLGVFKCQVSAYWFLNH